MLGRSLLTASCVLAVLISACGGVLFGEVPSPSPVTADSVAKAVDNSTMRNGHFRVTGTITAPDSNHYPVTGDGVLQRSPTTAVEMNLTVPINNRGGTAQLAEIVIGGKVYTRVGSGKWSSAPEKSTFSPTTPTKYVGEELIGATMTWHASSSENGVNFDIFVRETDGYIVFMLWTDSSSSFSMNFDTYNTSTVVAAP